MSYPEVSIIQEDDYFIKVEVWHEGVNYEGWIKRKEPFFNNGEKQK